MNNPLFILLIFGILVILAGALFWPQRGIFANLGRHKKDKMRILAEDCLKYLHDREYRKKECREADIAKTFSLSDEQATELITRLHTAGLVEFKDNLIHLTETGRADALQIVRIHRLLEQYMAEETSMKESEWHRTAEMREHALSAEQADVLAAQLGNPLFDPHGDPIPTADGDLPGLRGVPLNNISVGDMAKVIHIEDEPHEVYSRIVALGIQPGTVLRCLEKHGDLMQVQINGVDERLAADLIKNISITPLEATEDIPVATKRLSILKPGQTAKVVGIAKACRGQQRRRLMDLGVVPGSLISAELQSVGGDPMAYYIRGALIALRKQQANDIYIKDDIRS